jgi:N-carbamoylputrescine amidase
VTQHNLPIGLVQHSCTASSETNSQAIEAGIRDAAQRGARLIVLQELHNTPYFCQIEDVANFDLAEPVPGPTTEQLSTLSREFKVVIVGSIFERRDAGLYHNTAVVLDADGSLAGRYRKMHIPDDPGYSEKFYFTPGDLGFEPIDTSVGRLGVLVCWDQWFPEAARLMTLAGAQMLIYPTAIGWDPSDAADEQQRQLQAWITIQRGHAVANGVPVLVCNRVGLEPDPDGTGRGIQFWGHSFVAGPQGEILAQASADNPEVLITELDLARSEQVRRIWPYLRDRRIDAYDELRLRYRDHAETHKS